MFSWPTVFAQQARSDRPADLHTVNTTLLGNGDCDVVRNRRRENNEGIGSPVVWESKAKI